MSGARIAVVGSINVDLVARAPRLPFAGETQRGTGFSMVLGGKGANQAIAAARLGAEVAFVGCLGGDAFGAFARTALEKEPALSLEGVSSIDDATTGLAAIAIDEAGQNAITIIGGANDALTPQRVEAHRGMIERADVLLLQGEIADESNILAARIARAAGKRVIFDPAPVPTAGFPSALCRLASVLTPNETEAAALSGRALKNAAEAATAGKALLTTENEAVVIKMGSAGALLVTADAVTPVAPFKVQVVDTVAAGDCFNAGLAVGLATGIGWPAALRLASATGALATTRPGASRAAPTLPEVTRLLSGNETPA
jgi:ribokinase